MAISTGSDIDRYIIEGSLGEGGMAIVYRARHRELGSTHAIKLLKNPGPMVRQRLMQEGRLQSSLKHPNVLSVTDLVSVEGSPALVMEFVDGPSLAEFLEQHRPSLAQCDALARDILKGVSAAHAHGMIHRDLKPSNILLRVTEDAIVPKIADFGLAKALEIDVSQPKITREGSAMGTPAYMAPEQIEDASIVDGRADVFSLGAILYELVTGEMCFGTGNIMETWNRVCSGEFRPVLDINPDLPIRMARTIEDALLVNREHRITDVPELLHRWRTDEAGEHVPIEGRQNLNFWPEELREKTRLLAPKLNSIPGFDIDGEPDAYSQTKLRDSAVPSDDPDRTGSPDDPIAARVNVATNPNPSLDDQFEQGRPARALVEPPLATSIGRSKQSFLILAFFTVLGLGVGGWWSQQRISGADSSATNAQSLQEKENDQKKALNFQLGQTASSSEQRNFTAAYQAVLDGEFPLAERLLSSLLTSRPKDASAVSLMALTHFFRGRDGMAVQASERAASIVRDETSDLAKLLKLANRSFREINNKAGLLPQWKQLRDQHQDPIVELLYLVSARNLKGLPKILPEIRASIQEHPQWIALVRFELYVLGLLGKTDEMLKVAKAGVSRFPGTAGLLVSLAEVQIEQAQHTEAEHNLKKALMFDGSLTKARTLLAGIYITQNKESLRLEQNIIALGDTTSPYEQLMHLRNHGRQLSDHGRLRDAEKHWDLCVRESARHRNYNASADCAYTALNTLVLLKPPEDWSVWSERLQKALAHPELDSDLRKFYSIRLLWLEATIAARALEIEKVKDLIQRVESISADQLPFASRDWILQQMKLELLLQKQDAPGLEKLWKSMQSFSNTNGDTVSCDLLFTEARIGRETNSSIRIETALGRIIKKDCLMGQNKGVVLARSRVWLAELRVKQTKIPEARLLIDDFHLAWPNPDSDLPIMKQAKEVEAGF